MSLIEEVNNSPEWMVFLEVFWKAIEYASMTRKTRASSSYVGWGRLVDNSNFNWEFDWLDAIHGRKGFDGLKWVILQLSVDKKKKIFLVMSMCEGL